MCTHVILLSNFKIFICVSPLYWTEIILLLTDSEVKATKPAKLGCKRSPSKTKFVEILKT